MRNKKLYFPSSFLAKGTEVLRMRNIFQSNAFTLNARFFFGKPAFPLILKFNVI